MTSVHDESSDPVSSNGVRQRHLVRPSRFVITLVITGSLAVGFWQATNQSPRHRSILVGPRGALAPKFSLPNLLLPHQIMSLDHFRGRPVVLNFWASWCVPCRKEMPSLQTEFVRLGGRVAFIGVDTNDSVRAAREYLTHVHVSYLLVSDPTGTAATSYGLFGLPTTVFISSTGKIEGRYIGQLGSETLREAIEEAFDRQFLPSRSN